MTTFLFGFILTAIIRWKSIARLFDGSLVHNSRADTLVLLFNDLAFLVLLTQCVVVASVYLINPIAFAIRVLALLIVYTGLKNLYNNRHE